MAQDTRARKSPAKRVPRSAIPDVGGDAQWVEVLAGLLSGIQRQRRVLVATRVANGQDPDDPVAIQGVPQLQEDGTVNSYRLLEAECDEREQRLAREYPADMKRVEAALAQRDGRMA